MAVKITAGTVSSQSTLPFVAVQNQDIVEQQKSLEFLCWDAGSVARAVSDNILNYISGKTVSATTTNLYATGTLLPNTSRFTGDLDLSALSVGGVNMVLISPWHVIGSHLSATGAISFTDPLGNLVEREVLSLEAFSQNTDATNQNFVGLLDEAVTTITPISLLPATFTDYVKNAQATTGTPLIFIRKKQAGGNKVELLEGFLRTTNTGFSATLRKNTTSPYTSWSTNIVSGDSNGAVFWSIGGQAVLITSMNNTGGGRNYANHISEIQGYMDTLRAGETLQTVNLTEFNSY